MNHFDNLWKTMERYIRFGENAGGIAEYPEEKPQKSRKKGLTFRKIVL